MLVDELRSTTTFGALAPFGGKVQSAKLKSDSSTLKVLPIKVQAKKVQRRAECSIKSCKKSEGFIQAEADSQAGNLSLKF
ncbi:MAG: hypothetical protein IJT57_02825 [Selenomonadaceae bacterium]|nr:hypothetical protein [Selenomonadaceae bacterium]